MVPVMEMAGRQRQRADRQMREEAGWQAEAAWADEETQQKRGRRD